ncbi:MAG: hypothetical protein FJ009_02200 [Chloroflexi bacterium]|nr:hypothetical protein [Chloroflexota bacterium]
MSTNLIRLTILGFGLMLAIIIIGGVSTTSADVPAQGKPPTVALPTRVGTKPPTPTATATKPGVVPQIAATPVAPLKATVTRTPTKVAVRQPKGLPGGSWGSGIACTNLSTTEIPANGLNLKFYQQDSGTVALDYNDPNPLAGGASRNYFTPSSPPGVPSPFLGAVVVSAPQQLACSVNTQRVDSGVGSTSIPARIGTSKGVDGTGAATTLYAPQLFKNFSASLWNSYIAVQNTSSTTACNVSITYKDRYGNAIAGSDTTITPIPAQSMHIFDQQASTILPDNFLGGATITSSGGCALAAVVNFHNGAADSQNSQFHSYNAFSGGGNKLFVPRFVRNYYGFNGGMSIQNIGGAGTTVQITFKFAGNTYTYNSATINPGAILALYAPNITELGAVDSLAVGSRTGSAVIQAATGGTVVAIINEDNRGTCNAASCPSIPANQIGWGSTYETFPDGVQKTVVFFTQLTRRVGSPQYSGGFQVMNTTGTDTTCNIEYSAAPAANETGVALGANSSFFRFGPNITNLPDGYNSSAKVTCGQAAVGIGNLAARSETYYGDTMVTVNGVLQ